MIIKIKSSKKPNFRKVLRYMVGDKDRLLDSSGNTFVITHNIKGNNIDEWHRQYKENELNRLRKRKDSVYYTHEILSWHKQDSKHITLEKMESMARQYIQSRNPNGMFVIIPHFDKDHFHLHVCTSGIEYKTGKSMRLSKTELSKMKKEVQQYQIEKFPELGNSIVKHGKKEKDPVSEKEYQHKRRTGRETDKEYITAVLKTCYKKADSVETFFQLIEECGLKTYVRKDEITGVLYKNQKFRFSRLSFAESIIKLLSNIAEHSIELANIRNKKSKILHRSNN